MRSRISEKVLSKDELVKMFADKASLVKTLAQVKAPGNYLALVDGEFHYSYAWFTRTPSDPEPEVLRLSLIAHDMVNGQMHMCNAEEASNIRLLKVAGRLPKIYSELPCNNVLRFNR